VQFTIVAIPDLGQYFGQYPTSPAISGYLSDALNWRSVFAILVGLYAVSTIMVLIFGRETYYVANAPVAKSPTFVESLTGKGGALAIQRPSLSVTVKELILYIFRLPLLLVGELFSKFLFLFRRWKGRWGIDRNTDQDQVSQQW